MTLKEYLNQNDRFAAEAGIQLTEIREGFARAELTVEERHLNGVGVCQGGAIFTLADLSVAGTANSHRKTCIGINCQIHYVRSAVLGDHLTSECNQLGGRRLPLMEARVVNQKGELIAVMTAECYNKDTEIQYDALQ